MISRSSFKHLKQGDVLDGVVVSKVIYQLRYNKEKRILFEFVCRCGNIQRTNMGNFKRKPSKVCTQCSIESVAKQKEKYLVKDRGLYQIWKAMNWRCDETKGHEAYIRKGITVCQRWSESNPEGFNNFIIDMYPRDGNKTIERIDNTKGYSPDNCKWACMKEQQNNRENNHVIEYMSEKLTVQQLADRVGIKSNTLLCRLRRGWSVEESISGERVREYRRPYANKLTDEQFIYMMYELIELQIYQTSVARKYSVSPSNLSRITRDEDALRFYEKNKVNYEPLG